MKVRFDFVMHWLYAITWALLGISGFAMAGAKYGWIINFNYASADYVHRLSAAVFVIVTFVSIMHEVLLKLRNDDTKQVWAVIGRSGYQLFTFIVTLILIITGALIWVCIEFNMPGIAFALLTHEYVSYLALASIIWHIYKKSHALIWPNKPAKTAESKGGE